MNKKIMFSKLKNKTIAVLYGGISSERKISLKTGKSVIKAIKTLGFKVKPVDLDKKNIKRLANINFDLAFIALHGRYGEDGTVQGMLELLGKPYCGSGVISSSLCMNKYFTKKILDYHGIPTPDFRYYRKAESIKPGKFPLIIKPNSEGSSIGLSIVANKKQFKKAVKTAFKYDDELIIEKYIKGRELTVGVIGTKNIIPLPVIEIEASHSFFDFECKYTKGKTEYTVPAHITEKQSEKAQELAVKTYRALNCKGLGRVDMIMKNNRFYILELNTIPGMTDTSLVPMAAAKAGLSFEDLILKILYESLN